MATNNYFYVIKLAHSRFSSSCFVDRDFKSYQTRIAVKGSFDFKSALNGGRGKGKHLGRDKGANVKGILEKAAQACGKKQGEHVRNKYICKILKEHG